MWKSGNVEIWKSGNLEIKDAYYCPYPTQMWMSILLFYLFLLYEQEHKSVSDYPQGQ